MIINGDLTKVVKFNLLIYCTKPLKVIIVPLYTESFLCSLNTVTAQNHDNNFSDFPEVCIFKR